MQTHSLHLNVAISRARELGLHRESSTFGFPAQEIEIRRRIWAQLCVLDARYAEHLGREPQICSDTYDTNLPLSIDDEDLSDIQEQEAASRSGHETNFKSHQEVQYAQERQSPFSPMTFSLVGTEIARLQASLLSTRHYARDAVVLDVRNPRSGIRRSSDKIHWVEQVDQRLRIVYGLEGIDISNPLQYLISEFAFLSIAKSTLMIRVMEWREEFNSMSMRRKQTETTKYVSARPQDATHFQLQVLILRIDCFMMPLALPPGHSALCTAFRRHLTAGTRNDFETHTPAHS